MRFEGNTREGGDGKEAENMSTKIWPVSHSHRPFIIQGPKPVVELTPERPFSLYGDVAFLTYSICRISNLEEFHTALRETLTASLPNTGRGVAPVTFQLYGS